MTIGQFVSIRNERHGHYSPVHYVLFSLPLVSSAYFAPGVTRTLTKYAFSSVGWMYTGDSSSAPSLVPILVRAVEERLAPQLNCLSQLLLNTSHKIDIPLCREFSVHTNSIIPQTRERRNRLKSQLVLDQSTHYVRLNVFTTLE